LLAAFDGDSVIAAPEPVIVGLAAAMYPATHAGTEASVDETQKFLDAYDADLRGDLLVRAQSVLGRVQQIGDRPFRGASALLEIRQWGLRITPLYHCSPSSR
jgi:hypothetical protein